MNSQFFDYSEMKLISPILSAVILILTACDKRNPQFDTIAAELPHCNSRLHGFMLAGSNKSLEIIGLINYDNGMRKKSMA